MPLPKATCLFGVRVLFCSQVTSGILEQAQDEIAAADILASLPPNTLIPPEILANHMIASILALIRWWLTHDLPYIVEQMGSVYSHLISPC